MKVVKEKTWFLGERQQFTELKSRMCLRDIVLCYSICINRMTWCESTSGPSIDCFQNIYNEPYKYTHCHTGLSYEEDLCTWPWRYAHACLQVMAINFNTIFCVLLYICWTEGSKITFLQTSICQWRGKLVECIHIEQFSFLAVNSNYNRIHF